MFNPKDLSDPAWQAATTDEQILASIQNGKGKMPAFALPPATAESLTRLVRLFDRAKPPQKAAEAPANSGASTKPETDK